MTESVPAWFRAAIDAAPEVAGTLAHHEVSRAVGNVRNNDPSLIEPVDS